jgi:GT2 family glycosyltransferase
MIIYFCVFNDRSQVESMLLSSLSSIYKNREEVYKMVLIDNTSHQYSSAASAYNVEINRYYTANKYSESDILIFCHQDIFFKDCTFIDTVYSLIKNDANQIIGLAGRRKDGVCLSNLKYKKTNNNILSCTLKSPQIVCSLDECCFALSSSLFKKIGGFDDVACFNWHLYAGDLCYAAFFSFSSKIVVIPANVYHKYENGENSLGVDSFFLRTMWNLILKYRKKTKVLYFTCYVSSTNLLIASIGIIKNFIFVKLIGNL